MAYSDTLTYTLDAGSTSMADIMTALITHWNSAPGLWQIKSGSGSVAGEAVTIELKTGTAPDINIRRYSTTGLAMVVDDDNGITDPGDSSTPPTDSANAIDEGQTGSISGHSTRLFVCEYSDAISIIIQDSGKTDTPYILHGGVIFEPARGSSDVSAGMTGSACLVGSPYITGTNAWSQTSDQTDGSRIRTWDSSGGAHFDQSYIPDIADSNGAGDGSTSADGLIKMTRPLPIWAVSVNSSNDLFCGLMKYVAWAPYDSTFTAENPLTVLDATLNESWMYIRYTASSSGIVMNVEHNFVPS